MVDDWLDGNETKIIRRLVITDLTGIHAGVAWFSVPRTPPIKWSGRTNKSIRPDHNIPFEMIPLKLKIDTKHRLLMLNMHAMLMNIFRTLPRTSAIYLQRPLLVHGPQI